MTEQDEYPITRPDAQVHFGVFFQGVNHTTVWSDPESGSQTDFASFERVARTAERGLFDAFFLGEGLRLRESRGLLHDLDVVGRPDAITQLAALAAITEHIGLVATQNTTYNDPVDLARRLASLDVLSGGRAAWNVVTTDNAWTGENFRRGGYLDHARRYDRAEQVLAVARRVWDAWPDGDGPVAHVAAHGDLLDVQIDPTTPRSPQGHPVIFQAGDSSQGRDFAARSADVIFSRHGSVLADALEFAADIRRRVVAAGRPEDDVKIFPGTAVVVGDTPAEAEEKARWVARQQVTPATALHVVGTIWAEDLSGYDPDGPLPAHDPVVAELVPRAGPPPRAPAPTRSPPGGARWPRRSTCRSATSSSGCRASGASSGRRRTSPTSWCGSSGPARSTGSTSARGSCRRGWTTSWTGSSPCCRSAAPTRPRTPGRPCGSTWGCAHP
jgi:FMN-dependent oxidoreductase (nitrilotriacetate monooxygenase family)